MMKLIVVLSSFALLAACAVTEEMNRARPVQVRSICDALVDQVEKADTAEHLDKASKLYQKHQCA